MAPKIEAKFINSSFDKVKQKTSVLSSWAGLGLELRERVSLSQKQHFISYLEGVMHVVLILKIEVA